MGIEHHLYSAIKGQGAYREVAESVREAARGAGSDVLSKLESGIDDAMIAIRAQSDDGWSAPLYVDR